MTLGHLLFAFGLTLYMAIAVVFEERDLVAYFGKPYQDYRRRVPMFVPRFCPLSAGAAKLGEQSEPAPQPLVIP